MGIRGPKPVDMHLLDFWECEFHKAFRSLRERIGVKPLRPSGFTKQELRTFINQLKRMTPEHYWLTTRRLSIEMGTHVNLARPPLEIDRSWAEQERDGEIHWMQRELDPPKPQAQAKRRKIWTDLVRADSYATLRKACGRWARLPDVRRTGMTSFPEHVAQNASQFLSMKRNKRFPRSTYADDGRIDHLARGMAGVLVGRSPMTGVERLRNMKHAPGGPLWITRQGDHALPEREQHCGCWRCTKKNWNNITKLTQRGYENGLRVFMELAATTKVPMEWSGRKRL